MKLYALENSAGNIDITSIRTKKDEVLNLIIERNYIGRQIRVWLIEYDNGQTPEEDLDGEYSGNPIFNISKMKNVLTKQVWPTKKGQPL